MGRKYNVCYFSLPAAPTHEGNDVLLLPLGTRFEEVTDGQIEFGPLYRFI